MAEYVPVYSRRERRFRNLGKVLFIAVVLLVLSLMASMYFSIIENEFQWDWVELENEQGEQLNGLLLTPNDVPDAGAPAVIVTHDLGGHKEQLNRLSFELARQGYVVLALDLRDHGMSQGTTTYDDYYDGEPYDLVAAYLYLRYEVDAVDPNHIGMVGDGFGGAACLMANNILLDRNETVEAIVAWGPPIDVTALWGENRDEIEPYIDRRAGDVNLDKIQERDNRSAKEHMDNPNWTASNVFIIYGGKDKKVPVTQYDGIRDKADLNLIADLGHDLSESDKVLELTIDFLYRKLEKTPRVDTNFNYETVEMANLAVHASSMAVMIFAFLMVYEVLVMKKTSRSFISQYSRERKPMVFGMAILIDVVAYVAIASTVGALYNLFQGDVLLPILPAARFYTTLVWAGSLMLGFGMILWWIWSWWLPRDEDRQEETCGNLRGIGAGMLALVVVIINYLLGQVLLFGPDYPKDLTFLLVVALVFVFFLGHELWVRKLLYMKVNALLSMFFLRHRLPYHLTVFGAMFGLYVLLSWVMLWNLASAHFDVDFGRMFLLFTLGVGFPSTVIYHRSKSILASTTYSAIIASWLLNLAHHL